MNKVIFTLIFVILLHSTVTPAFAAAQPKVSCADSGFIINNLPKDGRKIAVRINDTANDWNLEKPLEGDFADKITPRDGKFSFKAIANHTYSWWIHVENADGTYGGAIGGEVYCGAATPSSFSASCKDGMISLSWKKVESAKSYAVRVNDTQNIWDAKNMLPGDIAEDNINGTKFSTKSQVNHGYSVWIHAVDNKGVYSAPAEVFVSCRKNTGSVGFLQTIRNFFGGFFS